MTDPAPDSTVSPFGWLRRILVLAGHAFTQLVRMKVFYFLLVFCVVLFIAAFALSSVSADQELKIVKDSSFGVMQIFSCIFGIVGMALLLPKDLEDRTLYTILSKPVRRWEYLLGKYLGVLAVLLVSLVAMDLLATGVLQWKLSLAETEVREDFAAGIARATEENKPEAIAQLQEDQAHSLQHLRKQGPTWAMHLATLAVFLKAAVCTAVALLISTVSGSTIFTILAALAVFVIGHMQASARETFLEGGNRHSHSREVAAADTSPVIDATMRIITGVMVVVFPDFQIYNVVDAVVAGKSLAGTDVGKMFGISLLYATIYLGIAAFIFSEKEL